MNNNKKKKKKWSEIPFTQTYAGGVLRFFLLLLFFFCSFIIQVVKCHSKFQFNRPILSSLIDASKQTTAAFFHEDRSIIP